MKEIIYYDPNEKIETWIFEDSELKKAFRERKEYKERINKAIEILNGMKHIDRLLEDYSRTSNIDKVINILKGEDYE